MLELIFMWEMSFSYNTYFFWRYKMIHIKMDLPIHAEIFLIKKTEANHASKGGFYE